MHLFGSHTFSMINARNDRVWVKFHFPATQQGIQNSDGHRSGISYRFGPQESHVRRDLLTASSIQATFSPLDAFYPGHDRG